MRNSNLESICDQEGPPHLIKSVAIICGCSRLSIILLIAYNRYIDVDLLIMNSYMDEELFNDDVDDDLFNFDNENFETESAALVAMEMYPSANAVYPSNDISTAVFSEYVQASVIDNDDVRDALNSFVNEETSVTNMDYQENSNDDIVHAMPVAFVVAESYPQDLHKIEHIVDISDAFSKKNFDEKCGSGESCSYGTENIDSMASNLIQFIQHSEDDSSLSENNKSHDRKKAKSSCSSLTNRMEDSSSSLSQRDITARQLATSKRVREKGKFKKTQTKWIPVNDFFNSYFNNNNNNNNGK